MQFEICELFKTAGTIEIVQSGLYYDYSAKIHKCRETFVKLFCHNHGTSISLGLFAPSVDAFVCCGRISVRQLGVVDEFTVFSTCPEAWKKETKAVEDLRLPEEALVKEEDGGYAIAIARYDEFPSKLLPYFCFFTPLNLMGVPCLVMRTDRQGRPIVQSTGDALGA